MSSPSGRYAPVDRQPSLVSIVAGILVSSVAASAAVAGIAYSFHASMDVVGYAAGIALLLALCVGVAVNSR